MNKHDVRTPAHALSYITDCTLATVERMAMLKSRKAGEYKRQIMIAQQAIIWMDQMGVDYTGTRAEEAMKFGSVEVWAASYEV